MSETIESYTYMINELDGFIENHCNIYIYGMGNYGKICYTYVICKGYTVNGFITTSGGAAFVDLPNYCSEEIVGKLDNVQDGIILALSESNCDEVMYFQNFQCDYYNLSQVDIFRFQMEIVNLAGHMRSKDNFNVDFEKVERILVIQLEKTYGDLLWSSAFLRELRYNYPKAEISMVINEKHKELFDFCPYLDQILLYEGLEPESVITVQMVHRVLKFANEVLKDNRYDAVFLPRLLPYGIQEVWENILLMNMIPSGIRVGHAITIETRIRKKTEYFEKIFTKIVKHRIAQHEVYNDLKLLSALGIHSFSKLNMEVWLSDNDREFASKVVSSRERYNIVLVPRGSTLNRAWSAEKYVQVFCDLINIHGIMCRIYILGGNDSLEYGKILSEKIGNHCVDMTGRTTLRQAAAIIERCNLYVGVDTGLLHMASAMAIPSVMLSHVFEGAPPYIGSAYVRTGPWQNKNKVLCPKIGLDDCNIFCRKKYSHCINNIQVEEVEQAILKIIHENKQA